MKIAIQGVLGSFHALVAGKLFSNVEFELIECSSFSKAFESLRDGAADVAIVASDNSLYGSIREVYDLLLEYSFPIIGEHTEHIHQQLIVLPNTEISDIKEVYSHPVAIDQCRSFLAENLPNAEVIESSDTADSVKYIRENNLKYAAAIASSAAAEEYQMQIVASDIEDEKTNLTRFVVLGLNRPENNNPTTRASMVLTAANKPGALYEALGVFAKHGINLTKLESRPIRGEAFRYQFFIDADSSFSQMQAAITELEQSGGKITVLGFFNKLPVLDAI